ncbi:MULTISPECIES: hypothetical protein [Kitasatospora]|uniref:Proteinase inhibitor I42 chagasin domain-containing protein n=1 Tax=Kitasatospora setae (strain ATCC 33774 / DSM 43861 / JCM 3304 / KCC A-0304 / NBRC 14216 / KM-6054) TaxID=452652 RepID=E4NAZ3_KITSK|nr:MULTISPECIES: hypothetical protein [Kitasatospora]BAJ28374.1 hypothetical protein KSE_25610 [Kitasatospora setae KM-6054]
MRGEALWAAVLALVLAVPVWGPRWQANHGRVFASDTPVIAVRSGQVFSLHWSLSVDPGMYHRPAQPPPDPAVVVFTGIDRTHGDPALAGYAGELYLVFRAEGRGTTELTVDNCQADCGGSLDNFRERRTYRIVVR